MDDKNGLKSFLSEVAMLTSNALTVSREVLKDGKEKVTVDLRKSKVMPERMESPPRCHEFYDVGGFIKFLEANKTEATLVLANVGSECITAVLDDRAKLGFENVSLRPAKFPAFEMLEKMIGDQMAVRRFAELLMRNRAVLGETEAEGKQLAMLMQHRRYCQGQSPPGTDPRRDRRAYQQVTRYQRCTDANGAADAVLRSEGPSGSTATLNSTRANPSARSSNSTTGLWTATTRTTACLLSATMAAMPSREPAGTILSMENHVSPRKRHYSQPMVEP